MPMTSLADPLNPLLGSLNGLKAAGEVGFEGMLRDAVAKVVGRHLRLVKPGPQGGIDMGTDPSDAGPSIAVEAKRYGQRTALGLDQLKAKLVDAVHRRPELDLLVFGATREISHDDQGALVKLGEQMGIGVAAIDWPRSATVLPPLAVLCALAPEAVLGRIKPAEALSVKAYLDGVRQHAGFAAASTDLIARLIQPDMGWSAARRAMADWLRKIFADRNAAFAELGSLVNLLDEKVHRVPRPRLHAALDQWWAKRSAPLALLGEEGVGKSWAPLAWWHERAGPGGAELPLTLVIPAGAVVDTDIEALVARLLAERTGLRHAEFWRRRVDLWLKSPAPAPEFLLVFDGLNEHWTFRDWDRILAQLADDPWCGKAAAILTCRPDHWTQKLQGLARVQPAPDIVKVKAFDDGELNALLALHGRTRDDFVPDLLPLLQVPRLCDLAIRLRSALAESGDITPERLVYENIKDQVGRARLPISDAAFHEFVAGLGRRLHEQLGKGVETGLSLSRRELTDELGAESGQGSEALYETVSEIVDGRWMEPVAGRANRFLLNKSLNPFALGMALVETLRETPETGLSDRLAAFMEPLGEQDLAVNLLRAAVTVALVDSNCSAPLRQMLAGAWLRRQNFRQVDFEAFWRLLPQAPDVFFAVAEETWLHRLSRYHKDEVLIKGFANAASRWPEASGRISAWCATWLGTHWADPLKGMVINYDPHAEGVTDRRVQTQERRATWDAFAGSLTPAIPIRDGIDGNVPWLICRVLGILSYVPLATFIPALTAWAVSRAIMGVGVESDQVAWILRFPPVGDGRAGDDRAVCEAVQREAQRLLDLNQPVASEAARRLLAALATPDAAKQAEALTPERPAALTWPSTVTVDDASGLLHWDSEAARKLPRSNDTPLWAARDLNGHAVDPHRHVSPEDAASLRTLADAADTGRLWRVMGNTSDDIALNSTEAALARWAPDALGVLYRRLFMEASSRTDEALKRLGVRTPTHLLLLGEAERAAVACSVLQPTDDNENSDPAWLDSQLAALAERPASEQIAVFLQQRNGPDFNRKHQRILAVPTSDDFVTVAEQLRPDAPMRWLRGWLWYLSHVPLDALPPGYPALVPLLTHADVQVRQLALEIVDESEDPGLAAALADSPWRWAKDMDQQEAINGSLALLGAIGRHPVAEIRQRINPQAWGILAIRDDATEADLDAFAGFVKNHIEEDLFGHRKSRSISQHFLVLTQAIERLVELRGDQVVAWIQPLISGSRKPQFGMFLEEFPYIDLCHALLHHRPTDGAALWRAMREDYDRGIFKNENFLLLPFEAPDSDPVSELRHLACDQAKTDEELGKIATRIIEYGRQEWLIGRIHQDLGGASAGQMARGLWLAGMLDHSAAADELWRTTLTEPPAPGWLADVHALAGRHYRRNLWAHQWLSEFLAERDRDRDRAFGRHRLFLRCADHRAFGWAPKCVGEIWDDLPKLWQVHWSLCWPELGSAIKEKDKEWTETLFGSKITSHIQRPWR